MLGRDAARQHPYLVRPLPAGAGGSEPELPGRRFGAHRTGVSAVRALAAGAPQQLRHTAAAHGRPQRGVGFDLCQQRSIDGAASTRMPPSPRASAAS